jgi:hypothetical protein
MSTMSLLHNLIQQALPELHQARLKALMAAVEAGLKGVSVSLTALGRALPGPAYIKHKIKRIDRLLGNPNLKAERQELYRVMTRWLLQSLPLPLIIIDWSPLTADQSQQLLRAALPTGGRTFTLYEESHPRKKLGNPRAQQQFLSRLQAFIPSGVTPIIIVADAGFHTPFFRAVEALNWHWLGRIRGRDFIAWVDQSELWLPAKSLYARATRKAKCLGKALWVRRNPLPGFLVAFYRSPKQRKQLTVQHRPAQSKHSRQQAAREKEPWLLVVSPSLKDYTPVDVVNYYRSRMPIEEGFRDTKSTHYGVDLTQDSRISADRRANLLLIAALIIFALWLVGLGLKGTAIERQIKVCSNHHRSPYSVIFLARIACQYMVFEQPENLLEQAQALLVDYFSTLEKA